MKKTALAAAISLFAGCTAWLAIPATANAATFTARGIAVRYPATTKVYNNGTAKITPTAWVRSGTHKTITSIRSYVYRPGAKRAIAIGSPSTRLHAGRYALVTKVGYRNYRLVSKTFVTNHTWTPTWTTCEVAAVADRDGYGYGTITRAQCSNWDDNGTEHDTSITANPTDVAGQTYSVGESFSTDKVTFRWTTRSTKTSRVYTTRGTYTLARKPLTVTMAGYRAAWTGYGDQSPAAFFTAQASWRYVMTDYSYCLYANWNRTDYSANGQLNSDTGTGRIHTTGRIELDTFGCGSWAITVYSARPLH